jgi:hypothetical protein
LDGQDSSQTGAWQEFHTIKHARIQRQASESEAASSDKHDGSVTPGTDRFPQWCPSGLNHTQKRRVQRLRTMGILEGKKEEERDRRFNQTRHMVSPKETWKEKRLVRKEGDDYDSTSKAGERWKMTS